MAVKQRIEQLSVLIPAYQEIVNLRWLLPRVIANIPKQVSAEVVVVVERDCDETTKSEIESYGAIVLVRKPTDSFGDAMRTGMRFCVERAPWLVVLDADGSHDPASIPILLSVAEEDGADIAIASRYVSGGGSDNSFLLYWMSRFLNLGYSLVLGLKIKDVSTNFKLYRSSALLVEELQCENFDIVEEILARAARANKGLKVVEVPDYFSERKAGESKRKLGPFIASYLLTLFRLRRGK
jgi:dolichol-phosphate mannosyltransferase